MLYVVNKGRMEGLLDGVRGCMSQLLVLDEVLRDPFQERNILSSNLFHYDRVGIIINPNTKEWFVVPKNYKDDPSKRKALGKSDMAFMTKTDITLSGNGDVVSILTVKQLKTLPDGVTIKLKVVMLVLIPSVLHVRSLILVPCAHVCSMCSCVLAAWIRSVWSVHWPPLGNWR